MEDTVSNLSKSFNYMIDLYLKEKHEKFSKHNPLLNITKFLIIIYDEINLINPYLSQNILVLMDNLTTYGFEKNEVQKFLDYLEEFYQKYIINKNNDKTDLLEKIYFCLIDMVKAKSQKKTLSANEIYSYENLIYSRKNNNPIIKLYNLLINKNPDEIFNYWLKIKEGIINPKIEKKPLLDENIYRNYGLSYEEISKMSVSQILKINEAIKKEEDNKSSGGGRTIEKPQKLVLTSGNAVIDSILFLGFIATGALIGFIILLGFIK